MSGIDKATIRTKLETLIETNYAVGSIKVDDVLSIALSTSALNQTNFITVDTVDDLPDILFYNSPVGMIYFVKDLAVFAINTTNKWVTLDGRLLRQE